MKRPELEKLILEPDSLERLAKWSAQVNSGARPLIESTGGLIPQIQRAEAPAHLLPELERKTPDLTLAGTALTNIKQLSSFLPNLTGHSPIEVLKFLEKRFRSESSPENAALLQAAINAITTIGGISNAERAAIDQAMRLFHGYEDKPKNPGTDDIWYRAFVDAGFSGAEVFDDLTPGWVYWRRPDFRDIGLNDTISSLYFGAASSEAGGNVILFENIRYEGRYLNFTVIPEPQTQNVPYVGDAFNDITSSSLIVRRFPNESKPLSLGLLVPQEQITQIVTKQKGVSPAGPAIFTWDMWPTGPTSGSDDPHPDRPDRTYIYVIVPINVSTPWPWPDYYAQVRFWIYLYVDNGAIHGYVEYYGEYVESGAIHDSVASGLMARIPGTIGDVNALVAKALSVANDAGRWRFVYYLPGRNEASGSTWDDISIVAVP